VISGHKAKTHIVCFVLTIFKEGGLFDI